MDTKPKKNHALRDVFLALIVLALILLFLPAITGFLRAVFDSVACVSMGAGSLLC